MFKKLLAGAAALVLTGAIAFATGLFPGLPMHGGVSYCASWSGVSGSFTCSATVPAGATAFTGNEALPGDDYGPLTQTTANAGTAAGNGAPPQRENFTILRPGNGGVRDFTSN